jgi:antitoxin ParD1/3/4
LGETEATVLKGEKMSDITIKLPDPMKEYVDARLASGQYSSATEFFSYLLCEDQKRRAREILKSKVRDAEASGPTEEITPGYWEGVEKTFRETHGQGPSA